MDDAFAPVCLNLPGIDEKSLLHLKRSPDRAETVLLWIDALVELLFSKLTNCVKW